MKKLILLASLFIGMTGYGQTVVYFDFLSHNEETNQWNGNLFYTANRAKIVSLATYFQTKGATWNMQSDWVYLNNVLTKETPMLTSTTNNKNILRWMHEDKGVEMDPHAHESQFLYPDVVKLMDSVGLPESKVMGGTIYNDSNGINIWTNLVNGQYGRKFPDRFWQPDYMMGGGTPNHVDDLKYYGFWNPKSPDEYLVHNPASHLRHIGVGCEMKIRDTTTVSIFVAELKDVIQKVKTGQYNANGIYFQTIFFSQADLNTVGFYEKVMEITDSVDSWVDAGDAQWKTFKQTYTDWETTYAAQMYQWECGQIATGIEATGTGALKLYPNPATDRLIMEGNIAELELSNILGETVLHISSLSPRHEINLSQLRKGIYLCRMKTTEGKVETRRVVVE